MKAKVWICVLFIIPLFSATSMLSAQEVLEVVPSGGTMETITDSAMLTVRINNLTDRDVDVSGVTLHLPESFGRRVAICDPAVIDFIGKESRKITCRIEGISLARHLLLIFFRHTTYDVEIDVPYRIGKEASGTAMGKFPLAPLAPWPGVVLGGILGVFLLLAFRETFRKYQPGLISATTPFLISAVVGMVVVIIVSILFRYADVKQPDLPFAVQVRDFIGGIFMGLLFQPIALWLAKIVGVVANPQSRS